MKRTSIFLAILILMVCTGPAVYAETENLLLNGSFEDGEGELPESWSTWAWKTENDVTEFKVEEGEGHSGSRYATIISNKENDARYMQMVNVEEESHYLVTGWIKTDNIGQNKTGANISIEGRVDTSKDFKGTNGEWTYAELYIKTGKAINSIVITLGVGGYGNLNTGRASFDDIRIEKIESIPDGVSYANIEQTEQNDSNNSGGDSTGTKTEKPLWLFIPVGIVIAGGVYFSLFKNGNKKKIDSDEEIFEGDFIPDDDDND